MSRVRQKTAHTLSLVIHMGITVLSLFDGISCGQLALKKAGIPVDTYYASEIDKHAIAITQRNFPHTVQLGSVESMGSWDIPHVNLILAGSPCQGFSLAGALRELQDPRSALISYFFRALSVWPSAGFLLENVVMRDTVRDYISSQVGSEPVLIDSASLSAQSRKRLYWASWSISLPPVNGPNIMDIIPGNYIIGGIRGRRRYAEPGKITGQWFEARSDQSKSNCLTTVSKDNVFLYPGGSLVKLDPSHYEILQGLPSDYTAGIPKTHRIRSIGNAWQVDTITHILNQGKHLWK